MADELISLFGKFHYKDKANAYELFRPTRAITNQNESALFMKRLLTVAVCNLLKLRGILPEAAFHTYYNRDFEANVLIPKRMTPRARRSSDYVKKKLQGAFDAIERRYIKQLKIRVISKGPTRSEDVIELFTFDFCYEIMPLIRFSYNGTPVCPIEVNRESGLLVQSVNTLLKFIFEMGITLPPLSEKSKPFITMWMKKTDNAPLAYVAPSYGYLNIAPPLRYPHRDMIVNDSRVTANQINTGFNQLRVGYEFIEGDFRSSELFLKYYGNESEEEET